MCKQKIISPSKARIGIEQSYYNCILCTAIDSRKLPAFCALLLITSCNFISMNASDFLFIFLDYHIFPFSHSYIDFFSSFCSLFYIFALLCFVLLCVVSFKFNSNYLRAQIVALTLLRPLKYFSLLLLIHFIEFHERHLYFVAFYFFICYYSSLSFLFYFNKLALKRSRFLYTQLTKCNNLSSSSTLKNYIKYRCYVLL